MTNRNQFVDESNIADPDQILLSIFKTTATTVTQLYKESLNQSTKSYKNGYKQCLLDLIQFASLQRHKRDDIQRNIVALTFDELTEFYNTKQSQVNSIDEGSQGLSHSLSMPNEETNNNTNDNVLNNNNINNVHETNSHVELDNEITTEKNNNNFNNIENENIEKQNLTEIKTSLGLSKGFTFRFNDQISSNFNNINFINNQGSLKRRLGGVSNTINFFGKTFNFDNINNDEEPPCKRNRWRRDDRMTE